jgi:hypothetical protein
MTLQPSFGYPLLMTEPASASLQTVALGPSLGTAYNEEPNNDE